MRERRGGEVGKKTEGEDRGKERGKKEGEERVKGGRVKNEGDR